MKGARSAWAVALAAVGLVAPLAPVHAQGDPMPAGDGPPLIAAQLFTTRDVGSFEDQVRLVAGLGFEAIESAGRPNLPAAEARAVAEAHGVAWPSAHVFLNELRNDLDGVAAYYGAAGVGTVVLGWLAPDERPGDAAGWRDLGRELGEYGAALRAEGLTLAYHTHDFEMEVLEGRPAIDHVLAAADPADLAWQADVAWIVLGGQDPVEMLTRHAGRVVSIHAKDVAAPGTFPDQGGFADVGAGVVDWGAVLPAARAAGADLWIVEHDRPGDPARALRAGRAFLGPFVRREP